MVEPFIALLQWLTDVRKNYQDNQVNILDKFVEPTFALFEAVHQNNLKIFEDSRQMIQEAKPLKIDEVIKKIKSERLLTETSRVKIKELPSEVGNEEIQYFIATIKQYLLSVTTSFYGELGLTNASGLRDILIKIDTLTFNDLELNRLSPNMLLLSEPNYLCNGIEDFNEGANIDPITHDVHFIARCINQKESYDFSKTQRTIDERRLDDETKRYFALLCLEYLLNVIRVKYQQVYGHYMKLKLKLLQMK